MGHRMSENTRQIEQLILYHRGELPDAEARILRRKIDTDPELRELYAMVRHMEEGAADLEWPRLADAVEKLSDRLFDDYGSGKDPMRGVLVYDSELLPLPEGVRPATVDTRRLRYRLGEFSVDVSLYPVSPESFELVGQVTEADRSLKISLSRKRGGIKSETDPFGLFRIERVGRGNWELTIADGSRKIGTCRLEI